MMIYRLSVESYRDEIIYQDIKIYTLSKLIKTSTYLLKLLTLIFSGNIKLRSCFFTSHFKKTVSPWFHTSWDISLLRKAPYGYCDINFPALLGAQHLSQWIWSDSRGSSGPDVCHLLTDTSAGTWTPKILA